MAFFYSNLYISVCKSPSSIKEEVADNQQVTKEQLKYAENQVIKVGKSKKTKDGWVKGKVMADPVMALDAASYLDVRLKNDVYEYYLDNKRDERNKMTENYKKFCSVLSRNIAKDKTIYEDTCKKINGIVFGKFIGGLWNDDCTKEQYIEINNILIKLTTLIEDGDIETVPEMYARLNKWFLKKYKDTIAECEEVN